MSNTTLNETKSFVDYTMKDKLDAIVSYALPDQRGKQKPKHALSSVCDSIGNECSGCGHGNSSTRPPGICRPTRAQLWRTIVATYKRRKQNNG